MREAISKSLKSCPSEVLVPKSLISNIFETFLKSCPSEVRVPWGRVPRGLTVPHEAIIFTKFHEDWTKIVDFLLMANF